jgi:eukaryotic-like serine/threonine-protein kinase
MTADRWRQVEELCHEALARAPEDRASFLAKACRGDADLRREVESLLAHDSKAAGFMSGPPAFVASDVLEHADRTLVGRYLGSYEVRSLLGVGGMGEVYRAHDHTLAREVAIKVLSSAFSADAPRRARLEREARLLASLNHPNICAIYGLADADGVRFLVLELVEGETLADRLQSRGAGLPLREVLAIAHQLTDALEVAHEKGIVHRDLKPANITITADGVVKVLDFGLAKAIVGERSSPDVTPAAVAAVAETREGVFMGTAAYMSPEQARGVTVDKRTDIWAFGCVLYEMLTGHAAFARETVSDTIVKILEHEPDWSALPETTRRFDACCSAAWRKIRSGASETLVTSGSKSMRPTKCWRNGRRPPLPRRRERRGCRGSRSQRSLRRSSSGKSSVQPTRWTTRWPTLGSRASPIGKARKEAPQSRQTGGSWLSLRTAKVSSMSG